MTGLTLMRGLQVPYAVITIIRCLVRHSDEQEVLLWGIMQQRSAGLPSAPKR